MSAEQNFSRGRVAWVFRQLRRFAFASTWGLFVCASVKAAPISLENPSLVITGTGSQDNSFISTGHIDKKGGVNYFALDVTSPTDLRVNIRLKSTLADGSGVSNLVDYRIAKVDDFVDIDADEIASGFWSASSFQTFQLTGGKYVLSIRCSEPDEVGGGTGESPSNANNLCENTYNTIGVNQVPLPSALWLFGSALIGFVLASNRRSL